MTRNIAKAGDLIKGKGKGDMNTGAKVILGGTFLIGVATALLGVAIVNLARDRR